MKALMSVVFLSLFAFAALASEINCSGTEPFWSLTVTGDKMVYSSPIEEDNATFKVVSALQAAGFAPGYITVIKSKYTSLTLVAGQCNDGMSDETYTHHAVFDKSGVILGGCCNVPSAVQAETAGEQSAIE